MELAERVRVTGWAGSMAAAAVFAWALAQFTAAPTPGWALIATLGGAGVTLGQLILDHTTFALAAFLGTAASFALLAAMVGIVLAITIPAAILAIALYPPARSSARSNGSPKQS